MTNNEMALMANIAVDMQKNEVNEVLDKIMVEIQKLRNFRAEDYDLEQYCEDFDARLIFRNDVENIIDKYRKAEE